MKESKLLDGGFRRLCLEELNQQTRKHASAARAWSIFAIIAAAMSIFLLILATIFGEPC